MAKIIKSLSLYWHYMLDILLTHVYVIAFLHAGIAMIAGLLMAFDSALKVLFSVQLSKIASKYTSHLRYRLSTALRFILLCICFFAITRLQYALLTLAVLLPYVIFKLLFLMDASLSSDMIFAASENAGIELTKTAAAQNILARASTAFAPALALVILNTRLAMPIACMAAILIGLLAVVVNRNILFNDKKIAQKSAFNEQHTFFNIISNPLMRWGLLFQLLANLAFSGVAFLLLALLKQHGNVFMNEITSLYAAFLFMQVLVLIGGDGIVPVYRCSHISVFLFITGILVVLISLTPSTPVKLILCATIGITYSITLSGVQKVVTTKLRGASYLAYSGWAQAIGRTTSFSVTAMLGLAMHLGISADALLLLTGIIGVMCALMMQGLSQSI